MASGRFKNLEFKVGLFVVISITLLAVALVTYAVQKRMFQDKVDIKIIAESGEGLSKSMPVKWSGFQLSRVHDVQLRDDGKVALETRIPIRYTKWIKRDSQVKLTTPNFIGSPSLVFSGGTEKYSEIEDGQTYKLERDAGIAGILEKAQPVIEDLKKIVKNIESITSTVSAQQENIQSVLVGLGDVGRDLHNKEGSLGSLIRGDKVKNEVQDILSKVKQIEDNIQEITVRVKQVANDIGPDVQKTADNSKDATRKISEAADNVKQATKNAIGATKNIEEGTKDIQDLRREADAMLNTTNRILLNMEEKWPFSSGKKGKGKVKLP